MPFVGSPLTAFTLIAAPAVLTNAAAVLALSTSNRFSRTLDRARNLAQQLDTADLTAAQRDLRLSQFDRAQVRSFLLLKALSAFYLALATLAVTSVISIVGTIATAVIPAHFVEAGPWFAIGAGSMGVGMLAYGCVFLVRETRLAVQSITEEAEHLRKNFRLHNALPEKFD
jgi:hypothetical protein